MLDIYGMTVRQILAENFSRLRAARPDLRDLDDIAKRAGGSRGTWGRVLNANVGVSVDLLETLARGYGLEAWQLLVPQLDPQQIPTAHEWPFPRVDSSRFYALSPEGRGAVLALLRNLIEEELQRESPADHPANGTHSK